MSEDISDFIRGQKDCKDGHPAKPHESLSYNRGYGAQYELEQANDWFSDRKNGLHNGHK